MRPHPYAVARDTHAPEKEKGTAIDTEYSRESVVRAGLAGFSVQQSGWPGAARHLRKKGVCSSCCSMDRHSMSHLFSCRCKYLSTYNSM